MKFTILLIVVLSLSATAQDKFPNFIQVNLTATDGHYFEDADSGKYIVSKTRFTTQAEAAKFCAEHTLPMSDPTDVMVLGMVGAEKNSVIADALSFRARGAPQRGVNPSGAVFWNHSPKHMTVGGAKKQADIVFMLDGGGMEPQFNNFEASKALLATANITGLPAICGHFDVPMDSISEDDSERGLIEEVESPQAKRPIPAARPAIRR